jgi:uncharacterized delta-60 repeat protein
MPHSLRFLCFAAIAVLHAGVLCLRTQGAPGDIDLSFDAGSGLDGWPEVFTVQPDGKVIMAGPFTAVRGLVRSGFARLNADGTGDSTFAELDQIYGYSGFTGLTLQPDGKVLMGHARGLARFNSDGTHDAFNVMTHDDQTLLSRPVAAIALQSDGKILIGGDFSVVDNTFLRGIARLDANGHLDPTFDPGSGINDGFARVITIAVQSDGKILIGGHILSFDGTPVIHMARLHADGSLDHTFTSPFGVEDSVYSMAVQPDGKVLVSGQFDVVNGTSRHRIARLHTDGSLDLSFDAGEVLGTGREISVLPDGKILVTGLVHAGIGSGTGNLVRLNADGSRDASFHPAYIVDRFALQADGRMIIYGTAESGWAGLARLHADGSLDAGFLTYGGVNGRVQSLAPQPDGRVLIGGSFSFVGNTSRSGIARLNGDGTLDSSFIPAPGINPFVQQICLQPDGRVLVSGYATTDDFVGTVRGGIIRLLADGSRDSSFDTGTGANGTVNLITLQADGKILIGGYFDAVNGVSRPGLARLNANGSLDRGFDPDPSGIVGTLLCIVAQPDGKVLAGGDGGLHNGAMRGGLTRFHADGSLDSTFNSGRGGYVKSIVLLPDQRILIAGYFSTADQPAKFSPMARLHADGRLDSDFQVDAAEAGGEFDPGLFAVAGPVLQRDGRILCLGAYYLSADEEGVVQSLGMFRLHADGSLDRSYRSVGGGGWMALQADGNVLIAGDFREIGGVLRPKLARIFGDNSMPALSIARASESVVLSWPAGAANIRLMQSTDLSLPESWSPVAQIAMVDGNSIKVTVPVTGPRRFFRLSSP